MLQGHKILTDEVQAGRALVAHIGRVLFWSPSDRCRWRQYQLACGTMSTACRRRSPDKCASGNWMPRTSLVVSKQGEILEGDGGLTREKRGTLRSARKIFSEYGRAVIHAHPRNLMVFACANRAMPPIMEATRKFRHHHPSLNMPRRTAPNWASELSATMRGTRGAHCQARRGNHRALARLVLDGQSPERGAGCRRAPRYQRLRYDDVAAFGRQPPC